MRPIHPLLPMGMQTCAPADVLFGGGYYSSAAGIMERLVAKL